MRMMRTGQCPRFQTARQGVWSSGSAI